MGHSQSVTCMNQRNTCKQGSSQNTVCLETFHFGAAKKNASGHFRATIRNTSSKRWAWSILEGGAMASIRSTLPQADTKPNQKAEPAKCWKMDHVRSRQTQLSLDQIIQLPVNRTSTEMSLLRTIIYSCWMLCELPEHALPFRLGSLASQFCTLGVTNSALGLSKGSLTSFQRSTIIVFQWQNRHERRSNSSFSKHMPNSNLDTRSLSGSCRIASRDLLSHSQELLKLGVTPCHRWRLDCFVPTEARCFSPNNVVNI